MTTANAVPSSRLIVLAVALSSSVVVSCSSGSSGSSSVSATPAPEPSPVAATVTVDFDLTLQAIRGFGGSSAWITSLTPSQADSLYGNDGNQQIGLSLLRVRIDPAGPAAWGTELNNAQQAASRGANVIGIPWTPPAAMKSNLNTVGGTLAPASYRDYANYLESFVRYMRAGGVSLYGISMQNEPDASVTYESCSWTPAQMDAWVSQNASVLTTRLIMPESQSFNTSYSDPALADPSAAGRIAIVAGHTYGGAPFYYTSAENLGKDVWMTEHYFTDTGITGALELAKEIHDSLTTASYNAYLWWWLQDSAANNYGNGLLDEQNNLTLNGYAMGQFSKFIRPGYVRATATENPSAGLYVSAYHGSGHYVIVALNAGSGAVNLTLQIQNPQVTTLTPYHTTATESLVALSSIGVNGGAATAALPAKSITTFVQ